MHQEIDETEWTDDSSAAMGLTHSVHYAGGLPRTEEALAREEKQRLRDEMERQGVKSIEDLEPSNKGAYAGLDRRTRELQAQGHATIHAVAIATEEMRAGLLDNASRVERDEPSEALRSDPDYVADDRINGEQLIKKRVDVAGGSSNGRAPKKPPSTKRTCKNCHLEVCCCVGDLSEKPLDWCKRCDRKLGTGGCAHNIPKPRKVSGGPGRPPLDGEARSERASVRMTPGTKGAIEREGQIGDVMRDVGLAIQEGRPYYPSGVLPQEANRGTLSPEGHTAFMSAKNTETATE